MASHNIFESAFPQHGERATESSHRKIELQSPADLTYLIANVSKSAREKLEKHLPADAPDAEMRKRVEGLVDEYVRRTFEMAKDSISVNGIEAREMEWGYEQEEVEPFDTKLAQKIQALSAQIERETLHLANKRRKAPQETAQKFLDSFESQAREYDERLKKDQEVKVAAARATNVDVGKVERVDEMQGTWARGREDLVGLKAGMEGTLGKMEKARKVVEAVEK